MSGSKKNMMTIENREEVIVRVDGAMRVGRMKGGIAAGGEEVEGNRRAEHV